MYSYASLLDTFDRVVVINLARRRERFARFTRRFQAWPFKPPQRFEAIDGLQVQIPDYWKNGPGAWGCMLSHQAVVDSAIADGVSSLLVLEDDAYPVPDFTPLAADFLAKVPKDWDCLMFGTEHLFPPIVVGPGVVRCVGSIRTHAYAVRGRMLPVLREFWKHHKTQHCDMGLALTMRYVKAYAPNPLLIGQDAGESDITGLSESLRFLSAHQIEDIAQRRGASQSPALQKLETELVPS